MADAYAGLLGAVSDLFRHAAGRMTHVAGTIGHTMAYGFRILLDVLAEASRAGLRHHAVRRE
ncbi:hypothetical protein UU5_08950 [Rhodanobacter sp. 115]|nr:hypothetical protein UU5_08950 [Rhodanobacter sp. 115]